MDGAAAATSFWIIVQILFLDLLLSGDNALVIALACRRLPPEQARRAAWIGAAGAIGLRLVLTLMAGALMTLPFLQLLSALPLLVIALNLMIEEDHDAPVAPDGGALQASMLAAAGIIIVSDAAMSLDNVVALAAVSGGRFWLLVFGLAVSIPLIVFGSLGFSHLMKIFPWITDLGGAMLGWIAGGMIASDPLLSGWVKTQAPALDFMLPLACAVFVLLQGRLARENAQREAASNPGTARKAAEKPAPAPAKAAPRPLATRPASAEQPGPREVLASHVFESQVVGSQLVESKVATDEIAASSPEPNPTAVAASESTPDGDQAEPGDRWMIFGLIALFVVFGLFLTAFVLISD